jgi:hypothetical protein
VNGTGRILSTTWHEFAMSASDWMSLAPRRARPLGFADVTAGELRVLHASFPLHADERRGKDAQRTQRHRRHDHGFDRDLHFEERQGTTFMKDPVREDAGQGRSLCDDQRQERVEPLAEEAKPAGTVRVRGHEMQVERGDACHHRSEHQ